MINLFRVKLCGAGRPGGSDKVQSTRRADHSTARRPWSPSRLHARAIAARGVRKNSRPTRPGTRHYLVSMYLHWAAAWAP